MIKVLIMDDEPHVCQLVRKIIDWEGMGFEIAGEAHDGLEGLEKAKACCPDVVIMDIRMPGIGGLELVEKIKALHRQTFFIIISGYKDFEYAREALRQGVYGYLLKPLNRAEFEKAMTGVRKELSERTQRQKEIAHLRSMVDSNRRKLAHQFFRNVIEEAHDHLGTEEQINQEYGCNLRPGYYRAVHYKFDAHDSHQRLPQQTAAAMADQISELFRPLDASSFFLYEDTRMIQLINSAQPMDVCMPLRTWLSAAEAGGRLDSYDVTIGIGSEEPELSRLFQSNRLAKRCINCRIKLGTWRIIDVSMLRADNLTEWSPIREKDRRSLITRLEMLDFDGVYQDIRSILEWADAAPAEDSIYLAAREIIDLIPLSFGELGGTREIRDLYQALGECGSLQQVKSLFRRAVEDAREAAAQAHGNYMINLAKEYVREHYMEEIQLRDIADVLNLTPKYFSELFKKETGVNFSDYLCQYRMDIAKDMLKTTCTRINEIADLVGYQDPKHFSKQFRKSVGVSPARFRKLVAK